jgi:hypothetical protein
MKNNIVFDLFFLQFIIKKKYQIMNQENFKSYLEKYTHKISTQSNDMDINENHSKEISLASTVSPSGINMLNYINDAKTYVQNSQSSSQSELKQRINMHRQHDENEKDNHKNLTL